MRLIVILGIISHGVLLICNAHAENLIRNSDFESSHTRTYIYDGVDINGDLDVGANSSPAMADINGDGKKDLVVGSKEGLIYCYINQGEDNDPKFTSAKMFQPHYGSVTFGDTKLYLIDWNNDAKMDILLGVRRGWLYLLKGRGDSSFGGGNLYVRRQAEEFSGLQDFDIGTWSSPISVDWDGDKNKDLIFGEGTYGANSVYIFLNKGGDSSPTFRKDQRQYLAYGMERMHLTPTPVDWDNDGDWDLIVGEKTGYLNLYINNPPERRVGEEYKVHVLEHSKNLEIGGSSIRLSYSAPFIVDWDNDGDMDLLCGSTSGKIYLYLNEGSKENPKLISEKILKGEDQRASFKAPVYWSQHYEWTHRDGVYLLETDETQSISGEKEKFLKLTCLGEHPGDIRLDYDPGVTLHDEKRYTITFYVKGQDIEGYGLLHHRERRQVTTGGVRGYEREDYEVPINFSVSSNWHKVEKTFRPPTKGKDKKRIWSLRFYLGGKGPFCLDKVSLQEVE